ncbi:hypothetical protein QJS04_geneDACA011599 [Acorus gramineus]|uniref:Uncharacterized protein n=1 Tax=Acorus gramineus TaxID=55184 RepID=A0AAV9A1A8_ACOGR|nr:hypothetical protein QJS04_geneDACA011599 [Acorus gramineus]
MGYRAASDACRVIPWPNGGPVTRWRMGSLPLLRLIGTPMMMMMMVQSPLISMENLHGRLRIFQL